MNSPRIRIMKQSDFLRCPFAIIMMDHYREDGTCLCTDPQHREMMKREWGYTDEHFRAKGLIP